MTTRPNNKRVSYGALRPEILFFAFWAAGVLVPLYPFIREIDGFSAYWGYSFRDKESALWSALALYGGVLATAVSAMVVGGLLANGARHATRRGGGLSFPLRALTVTFVALLSIVATIVLLGGITNWLTAGGDRVRQFAGLNFVVLLQNGLLSVSLAWFIRIAHPRVLRDTASLSLWAFSAFALALVALQGAKSTLFVYMLAMLVVWHVRVRPLPLPRLAFFGTAAFVLLMAYHVVKQELLVVGEFVFYDKEAGFLTSFGNFLFMQLTGNLMQLQCMTVLMDAMPDELPYQHGETLQMLWLIWVPSLLFPDKPLTAPGVFTMAFWPDRFEQNMTTMPPGLFGEFYMAFGWAGALVGAALFGLAFGFAYGRARRLGSDTTLALYALMAGVMLHYFRGELASVTVLLLSLLVPTWWMLRAPTRRPPSNDEHPREPNSRRG